MKSEAYLSPLHIIQKIEGTIPSAEELNLYRIRKKLITLIELEDHPELSINDKAYNKSELLKQLEILEDPDNKAFHYVIFGNKELLNFLELGSDYLFIKEKDLTYIEQDEKLKEFISPYFSFAYDNLLINAIQKRNFELLKKLKKFKPPVTFVFENQCFQSTYLYINKKSNELKDIIFTDETDESKAHSIKSFFKKDDYYYFQYLPSYLDVAKAKYAIQIAQVLNIQFKYKLIEASLVHKIYINILKGISSRENFSQIEALKEEYLAEFKKSRSASRFTAILLACIFGILALIVFIPKGLESYKESERKEAVRIYDFSILFNSIINNSNRFSSSIPESEFKKPNFKTGQDIYPIIFKPSDEEEQDKAFWLYVTNNSPNSVIAFIYPNSNLKYQFSNWRRSVFINAHDTLTITGFPACDYYIAFYTGKYWSDTLTVFNGALFESNHSTYDEFKIKGGFVSSRNDSKSVPHLTSSYYFCPNCRRFGGYDEKTKTYFNEMRCPDITVREDTIEVKEVIVRD